MEGYKVSVEAIRVVDYDIASGAYGEMAEHGWDKDDWPHIYKKVLDSDILVQGAPYLQAAARGAHGPPAAALIILIRNAGSYYRGLI
jgi:hypothetical protein